MRAASITRRAQPLTADSTAFRRSREDAYAVRRLLIIACVFTIVGGYTDAYSYIAHGHVFANAQTGNIVLLGVDAAGGDWKDAVRHLPPIAAFIAGVVVANLLGVRSQKKDFSQTLICQIIELTIVTGLAVLGKTMPASWIVPTISFVAAVQNTSLDTIGSWSFNSAMTTGNLRSTATASMLWLLGREAENNRGKALSLGVICVSFLTGALAGSCYTRLDQNHALVPCAAIIGVGIVLTWLERRRRLHLQRL